MSWAFTLPQHALAHQINPVPEVSLVGVTKTGTLCLSYGKFVSISFFLFLDIQILKIVSQLPTIWVYTQGRIKYIR